VADNVQLSTESSPLERGRAGRSAEEPAAAPTLGVEEEFLLLHPVSGQVVPAASELLSQLDEASWAKGELMRFQLEAVTDICTGLGQLRAELASHRQAAAALAEPLGCLLVAAGTAPNGTSGPPHVTASARYLELARRYPSLMYGSGTCGCHVHVGVGSRELGVQVLNRLRPWLPTLLALSTNSPLTGGGESGWASWRHRLQARWPTARPAPVCSSAAAYDAMVAGLIHRGAALDVPNVQFLARLSPRYPTVEVRVADVCLDLDDAVLLAGLVRALVTTAIQEAEHGVPVRAAPAGRIRAAVLAAARHGLDGPGLDPWSGTRAAQRSLLDRLLCQVEDALARSGDDQEVAALVGRLDQRGPGAVRQRALRASGISGGELAAALARATLAGCPHPSGSTSPTPGRRAPDVPTSLESCTISGAPVLRGDQGPDRRVGAGSWPWGSMLRDLQDQPGDLSGSSIRR
jgi:glutamate---cysteine ligase / carboxylate-amine ligase